jgi:hypothetical protein
MHYNSFERAIIQIANLFIRSDNYNFDLCINEVLEISGKMLKVERAFFLLFNSDRNTLRVSNEWVISPEYHSNVFCNDFYLDLNDFPFWRSLKIKPSTWILNSLENLPEFAFREKEGLMRDRVLSCLSVPVFDKGRIVGSLCYQTIEKEHAWSRAEIEFSESLSEITSSFIERAKGLLIKKWAEETSQEPDNCLNSLEVSITDMDELDLLSNATVSLLGLDTKAQIFSYAGQILYRLVKRGYVVINEYLPEENVLVTRHIYGFGNTINEISRLLGYRPIGKKYELIADIRDINIIKSSVLFKIEGGLHELTFGKVSKTKSKIAKALAGIKEIYGCGFHAKGRIFGTTSIFLTSYDNANIKVLESFMRIVSMALYRVFYLPGIDDQKKGKAGFS